MSLLTCDQRIEMDNIFLLQAIISFVVGGGFVSFLSLVAEKVPDKYAGIVLSLPSTVVVSFFFLSFFFTPSKIPVIVPSVIVSLGGMLVLIVSYLYLSKLKLPKTTSIVVSALGSVVIWIAFSVPVALFQFSNFPLSIIVYITLGSAAHCLISMGNKCNNESPRLIYSPSQKIFRACFAGVFITSSVIFSKLVGIFWGGILSVFPAAFVSTMLIYHWHYDSDFLFNIAKSIPLGSLILLTFVISSKYTFPSNGTYVGVLLSYCLSIMSLAVIYILIWNKK